MWKCTKCNREFQKVNQMHSCRSFALEDHFRNKEKAKELFEFLKLKITKEIGPIKIESLPCCIHFVSSYTFGACWAMKDKIRVDFRLEHPIKTDRPHKLNKISANRYLYYFDISKKSEIDADLISWFRDSYKLT